MTLIGIRIGLQALRGSPNFATRRQSGHISRDGLGGETVSISVSDFLGVAPLEFAKTGAFDAIMDVDSKLFIDPHLVKSTTAPELANSYARIEVRFRDLIKLLLASHKRGDAAWRAADRFLTFPEVSGLCIGYSNKDTAGSGMGKTLRAQVLDTAKQIVDAGIVDPEIFELIGLFEYRIGADRISDMVGRIILPDLVAYSERVLSRFGARMVSRLIQGEMRNVLINPHNSQPLLLVPCDVLRDLPIAEDWEAIDSASAVNRELRDRVNAIVGVAGKAVTYARKAAVKSIILNDPDFLKRLLAGYRELPAATYDFAEDRSGQVAWYAAAKQYVDAFPLSLALPKVASSLDALAVVRKICDRFTQLVENNGLSSLLYDAKGKPKPEAASQYLFYGIADTYCAANNLDLSRECNAGRGPVDFKVSGGYTSRVLVETKLSTNKRLLHGFETQVEEYQKAEQSVHAIFLVIDVGGSPKTMSELLKLEHSHKESGRRVPDVLIVDAKPKPSASKY